MKEMSSFLTLEQKRDSMLESRIQTWDSLVDEAGISEEAKEKIKKKILDFREEIKNGKRGQGDAVYYAISTFNYILKDDKSDESDSLFEILRDEMWDFYKENNKIEN